VRVRLAIVLIGALLAVEPGAAAAAAPALSARSAILVEETTGQRLYGANADQELPIASTTKLMTALIVLEHAKLNAVFTDPPYYPASVDSQIGLRPGERMSVYDLMEALLLPSADDAAEDLAFNVGRGSVGRFIGMMNARARELHLSHTHYSTPIGLDTPGNYSSASDLVRLASFLLQRHPFFRHVVSLPLARLVTGDHPRLVANRNMLIGRVSWINGVKTGHTRGAGYVLVGSGTQGRLTLISAVLGTPDEGARNSDTVALLSYGFANFHLVQPIRAGEVLARLPVKDQPSIHAAVLASRTFVHVVARGTTVRTRLHLPHELKGPLRAGTVVGSVVVVAGGRILARIPLRLARSIAAVSPLTLAARFLVRPSTLLFVGVLLISAATVALRRRGRASTRKAGARRAPAEPTEPA
jgi:D-alanyl-D-alanine carboxypeptidase (penicillin-binding protein 5/6)